MKKIISFLGLLLVVGVFAGCGNTQDNANPDQGTDEQDQQQEQDQAEENNENANQDENQELKNVTIQIAGAAVPYYAPLFVAKEKGYFNDQGLEVEFLYAGGADIVKNVAAGNVEFGFPNGDPVLTARSQDIPVKVAHTTYQHGLGATIYKKGKGIESPEDLKGKTVAVTSYGSPNYVQLQVMLKKVGLTIDDVNVEIVGTGSIVNALVDDQVDAITFSMLRTVELQAQGIDVAEFRSDKYLPSHGNVLITSEEYMNANEDTVVAFSKALNKGLQYMIDGNAKEAVDLAIKEYSPSYEGKNEIITKIFEEVFIPYLYQSEYTEENGLGASTHENWQESIDILREYDVIKNDIQAKDFVIEDLIK